MTSARLDSADKGHGLEDLIRKSDILNLVDATIAVVNAQGELVIQNDAFARFNASVRDSTENLGLHSTLLNCPAIQQAIQAALAGGKDSLVKQEFYYGQKIKVDLSLRIRPIPDDKTGNAIGAAITLGEESVAFDNRHLARMQESLSSLVERVRVLSGEMAGKNRLIRILLKEAPFPMVLMNEDRQVLQINRAGERLFGISERELMGRTCDTFLRCYQSCNGCPVQQGRPKIELDEITGIALESPSIPLLRSAVMFDDYQGKLILESLVDLTERRQAETQMRQLSSVVEQTADAVTITDRHGVIQYVNPAYERITGYSREEVLGKNANVVKSGEQDRGFYEEMWQTILAGRIFQGALVNRMKDGTLYYEEKTITPLKNAAGLVVSFVSTGKDITQRLHSEKRLQHLAHHDPLTDLPNRVLLQKRLNQAMREADQLERLVAVMFLDLDRFKTINDTLGHDVGDALLIAVAERLAICLRPGDTVSRLGGDEFTITLSNVAHVDDVTRVAQKILDQFTSPFRIGGRDLFVTPSIGITLYPLDEKDEANLLRDADIAMYRAKELGRNQFQFYTPELNVRAKRRLEMETGLRQAIERQELILHYQPLVDIKTGRIRGMEALLRWQHPEFGLIPPLDFIPLAEDTGLIVPIGEWVLKTACAQIKTWHDTGFPELQVAVNLSSKQLRDKNLINVVKQALKESGIEARYLDLELTESVLMQDMELASTLLKELKTVGVSFSLDDFGTGYSSLSYLKRFPIDYLKIDRSFIRDISSDPVGAGLVQAIIAMANVLNIKVIAEGVETHEQLEFLRRHGCDIAQGYFCSPPIIAETFIDLLRNWKEIGTGKSSLKD